jgi:hypothetical protein
MNSTIGKLLADAGLAALGAFVVGLCLVRTLKHAGSLYLIVMVFFGASFISDLFWTRREVRLLGTNEAAMRHASRFLWGCVFFSMISASFGMAVSGFVWYGANFVHKLGLVFWSALEGIWIYSVYRDAKRLTDAAEPSHIASG